MRTLSRRRKQIHVLQTDSVPSLRTARIGGSLHLPEVLQEFGVEASDALRSAALPADLFDDPDHTLTYPEYERLMRASETLTACDYIGLLAGQRAGLGEMGIAGDVARCGTTAGAGLRNLLDHFNLQSSATTLSIVYSGDFARLVYAIAETGMHDTRQLQLGGVAISFNILRELCGPDWRPALVSFATRAPSNLRPFQRFFRSAMRFDSDESAIAFEQHWLEQPLPPVSEEFRRRVAAVVRARRAEILQDFPATVRRVLRKQLIIGPRSMDAIAAMLGMHRRTLDRRLQCHGVAYGELLDAVKRDVACQLLADTRLQVQQIAESLHFSNAANFATAFRRWTGLTPTEYRRGPGWSAAERDRHRDEQGAEQQEDQAREPRPCQRLAGGAPAHQEQQPEQDRVRDPER